MNENKKQCLFTVAMIVLALIVGIATLFCIKKYDVHAEETDDLTGWIMVYSSKGQALTAGEPVEQDIILYMRYSDFDRDKMCLFDNGNGYIKWYSKVTPINGKEMRTVSYSEPRASMWKSGNSLPTADYTFNAFYIFASEDDAKGYLKGTVPATSATNYAEAKAVQDKIAKEQEIANAEYESSVPAPDKLYIQSLSATAVNSVFQYTDEGIDLTGMTYEVTVEHFYMSASLFTSIAKGYTGKNGEGSYKLNGTIDSVNRLILTETVEDYISKPTELMADHVLVSGITDEKSGQMNATNVILSVPTDYSDKFAASVNAFFTGATNSHRASYCGSQITVVPYKEIDGQLVKGNACVARRFTNEILNTLVGSTYTQVGQDESGNEYIVSSNNQDSNGNQSEGLGSIDDGNILQHVKNGFGLSGTDGYIALARHFFQGVPSSIWALLSMALAVSVAVIIFKALRGM